MKSLRIVNLERGLPSREEAYRLLDNALLSARKDGILAVKLIHGYGSSGKGGILRFAVRSYLRQRKELGQITIFIAGESWSQFEDYSKQLLHRVPETLLDVDLGRGNKGITLVLL